jgi:hypothetical protein
MRKVWLVLACLLLSACAQPQGSAPAKEQEPRREYREIKPEIWPIPEDIADALPGLLNDNFYLYREISPTLNLVAYVPEYSLEKAINMAAKAFMLMTGEPRYKEGIEFWIIQVQPLPEKGQDVMVWGVRPEEAEAYARTGDLSAFFRDSEYVLIDDEIIPAGDLRLKHWPQ